MLRQERIEAVIHFAAYISVGESTERPELYFSNNVCGSLSLFEAMLEARREMPGLFLDGSRLWIPAKVPIPEDEPYAPINPYGESKVMVEKILEWLDRYREFRSIRLRYFNACGAEPESGLGERHDPETHLIPLMLRAIQTGKPVTLFGDDYPTPDGTCIRDYIHVSDLAQAHIVAIEHLLGGGKSDVFNVGTGAGQSVKQVLAAVEKVTGKKVPHTIGPRREGDPPSLVADSRKLQNALGWHPQARRFGAHRGRRLGIRPKDESLEANVQATRTLRQTVSSKPGKTLAIFRFPICLVTSSLSTVRKSVVTFK